MKVAIGESLTDLGRSFMGRMERCEWCRDIIEQAEQRWRTCLGDETTTETVPEAHGDVATEQWSWQVITPEWEDCTRLLREREGRMAYPLRWTVVVLTHRWRHWHLDQQLWSAYGVSEECPRIWQMFARASRSGKSYMRLSSWRRSQSRHIALQPPQSRYPPFQCDAYTLVIILLNIASSYYERFWIGQTGEIAPAFVWMDTQTVFFWCHICGKGIFSQFWYVDHFLNVMTKV